MKKLLIIMGCCQGKPVIVFLGSQTITGGVLIERFVRGKKFFDKHLQVRQMLIGFPNKMPFDKGMKRKLNI